MAQCEAKAPPGSHLKIGLSTAPSAPCLCNLGSVTRQVRPLPLKPRTVLMLLMEGRNKPAIACKPGCSYHTVKDHVTAIYKYFQVHSMSELFRHLVFFQHRNAKSHRLLHNHRILNDFLS
ncbi:MAG: helix-turn-helix transcriptional regulator, partial [Steroidobacteraceae bacterium]